MPLGEEDPGNSPLNKRAWAFQERHTSRRKVFFMPGGMIWACKTSMLNERCCDTPYKIHEHAGRSWSSLLEEYTTMNLARVSDRLPAIQGIATEMSTTRADLGRYRFGVWEQSMPKELIWVHNPQSRLCRKVPGTPSWSWAKIEGKKIWPLDTFYARCVENTHGTLSIIDSGSLKIRGYLGMKSHGQGVDCRCVAVPVPVQKWILSNLFFTFPEKYFFWRGGPLHSSVQMVLGGSEPSRILGFGHFDERPQSSVFFSILASVMRDELQLRYVI